MTTQMFLHSSLLDMIDCRFIVNDIMIVGTVLVIGFFSGCSMDTRWEKQRIANHIVEKYVEKYQKYYQKYCCIF